MKIKNVPQKPGCYLFKDKNNRVIYIGKAKNLKKRIQSYFRDKKTDEKTKILVSKINDIEFFITKNEVEALILENNLIKKFKPRYNINLKESVRYAYILVTKEEFPRLRISRDKTEEGTYFGPFTSAILRDATLDALIKAFKIRTCKKLPKKACIRFHIGLCSAPCINNITKKDYLKNISSAKDVLKGKYTKIIKKLNDKMKMFSENLNFEKAIEIREQIELIKKLKEKQVVERQKNYDEDFINYLKLKNKIHVTLFNSKNGVLLNKNEFEIPYSEQFLEEFLLRYYNANKTPKEIIVPEKVSTSLKSYFKKIKNSKIIVPKKGEKKQILELVLDNIKNNLLEKDIKLEELKASLDLNDYPNVIECFDVSHFSGSDKVASMVQFKDGKPNKSNYRRYRLRNTRWIDDYASIKEVVRRRYKRLKEENLELPDLIIIDGGKGQLNSALEELKSLNIKIPIISIAKKNEEIFMPGISEPLVLKKDSVALKFIQEIRDEAHRFALRYSRLLRKKRIISR